MQSRLGSSNRPIDMTKIGRLSNSVVEVEISMQNYLKSSNINAVASHISACIYKSRSNEVKGKIKNADVKFSFNFI